MNLRGLKYRFSFIKKALHNANVNYKTIASNPSIYIDPEFLLIDSKLEGYNYLFGRGRLAKSSLGLFTYVQNGSNISNANIGRFSSIGPNVMIAHGDHPTDFLSTHPLFYDVSYIKDIPSLTSSTIFNTHEQVNIGSDVWIGANCYIKDGVTIGDGVIIGAGAIVTKDIPPYSIAVGIPATVIKPRFDEAIIEELMKIKWWNWEFEKITSKKDLFQQKMDKEILKKML